VRRAPGRGARPRARAERAGARRAADGRSAQLPAQRFPVMNQANTNDYHLVHANLAHARAALDSPLMAGFVAQVDEIGALARGAAGFVSVPTPPDEGVIYKAPFLLNVSIWESVETLDAFTHQGKHAAALERRGEWFDQEEARPGYVLYWI